MVLTLEEDDVCIGDKDAMSVMHYCVGVGNGVINIRLTVLGLCLVGFVGMSTAIAYLEKVCITTFQNLMAWTLAPDALEHT